MNRQEFIEVCDSKVKLVRAEYGFSQDKMARALGLSKKTMVGIEKGRVSLGWTASVALCTVFCQSEVIIGVFGGNPVDIILALAFDGAEMPYPKTLGGKVWWATIKENAYFKIQQNIISQHYRLLTSDERRIASSFVLEDIVELFDEHTREKVVELSKPKREVL